MDIEFIKKELQGLTSEREKAIAQVNIIQGAIQAYQVMLSQCESTPNGKDSGVPIEDIIESAVKVNEVN